MRLAIEVVHSESLLAPCRGSEVDVTHLFDLDTIASSGRGGASYRLRECTNAQRGRMARPLNALSNSAVTG